MASFSEMFSGTYLKSSDLQGKPTSVVIESIEMGTVGQGAKAETKPIVSFVGREKKMVLNKTNATVLAAAFGDNPESSIGKTVILFVAPVSFEGRQTEGLRIRLPDEPVADVAKDAPW